MAIAALSVLFTAAWLLYGVVSHTGMVLHNDVTEAYVWGRTFQLGYHQHPPFWAWIAGVWFLVFPLRDWAFLLLAVLNSVIGLLGAWCLIGRFVSGPARQAALLLLLCTPFYTFNSFKYNANSIFLSIWPWTLFCLLRALESRRVRDGVLLGIMLGIAMLSKYFAVILALTCWAGSMLHQERRRYWRSASPFVSMTVAFLLLLPHLAWLIIHHAPPIHYVLSTAALSAPDRIVRDVMVLAAAAGVQVAIPLLVWFSRGSEKIGGGQDEIRLLATLVLLPSILTAGFGMAFGLRLSAAMLIGTFPLAPVLVMAMMRGVDPQQLVRWSSRTVLAITAVSLTSAPIANRLLRRPADPSWQLPLREAAEATSQLWHQATGRPVVTVGGSDYFNNAAAFYNDDRPAGFLELEHDLAPWVTPAKLRSGGLLAMCLREDGPLDDVWCRGNAGRLATAKTTVARITLTHMVNHQARGTSTLDVYITPPEP